MKKIIYSVIILLSVSICNAQPGYHPLKISTPINIDGKLDENEWRLVDSVYDFMQTYPVPGSSPSMRTVGKILYDNNYIYVGVIAYDSFPRKLIGNVMERDIDFNKDDRIAFLLDTYRDKTNALLFAANILGSRFDEELTFNGDNYNAAFNTFWDVKTSINSDSYSVEFRIPLSSLRFQVSEDIKMGFKLVRIIARKNEYMVYPKNELNLGNAAWRVDNAREIIFKGLKAKKPFYATPYISANYSEQSKLNATSTAYEKKTEIFKRNNFSKSSSFDKVLSNVGIDVKYGISKNFTLDATVNTDFSQVEVDNRVVNLSRFSVFLPEKRNFFLEAKEYLSFNVALDYGSGSAISLFNSRNIGIENGSIVPIVSGLRLTGKSNGLQLGLLNMQTLGNNELNRDPQNFSVVRVRKDLYNNGSFVGCMFTNRVSTNSKNISNQTFALDYLRRFNTKWLLGLNVANTNDINAGKLSIQTGTYNVTVVRNVNLGFQSFTSVTYSGANFLPLSGFASDAGFADLFTNSGYYWKPKSKAKVAFYEVDLQLYNKYRLINKNLENTDYYLYSGIYYANGSILRMLYNWNREYLPFDWNFSKNIVLPKAYYNNNLILFKYVSKVTGNLTYQSKIGIGKLYNGSRVYTDPQLSVFINKFFNFNAGIVLNYIKFPTHYSTNGSRYYTNLLSFAGITYTASPYLSLKMLAQYDNISKNLNANVRFRYNPKEGTDLFIVYNPGFNISQDTSPRPPAVANQSLIIKFSKTLNL